MSLSRAIAVALTLSLAISACGGLVKLKPQQGTSLPVKPEEAATQLTVDEMLTPSPQARPKRSDELITRSQERREDKFDIPPKS
jgi:hypothetical protein